MNQLVQTFRSKVVGVTYDNDDGTSRQKELSRCKVGEEVKLVRELDNPHGAGTTIAVISKRGVQIGYMPSGDNLLANHMDRGNSVTAHIISLHGGPNFIQKIFGGGKSRGCAIEIGKGGPDWSVVGPYHDLDRSINDNIKTARDLEKDDPESSIQRYLNAIADLKKLDSMGAQAQAWRTAKYPVNRYSMLLDKLGRYNDAIGVIENYFAYSDPLGISKSDLDATTKRLNRLKKKLGN
ncbi:MAG: HIRAN domain-containing protein [Magnetospiraceae bacterium]